MSITIRPCTPQDAEALALVSRATFLESYADVLPAADILVHCEVQNRPELYRDWLSTPGWRAWLAEIADTRAPVGFSLSCPPDLPLPIGPGDVELKRIYLLHRFQGGGDGARLMAAAEAAARADGFDRLLLGVYTKNAKALGFYARQGFTQAGVRTFQVGSRPYDDLVLAKARS
ncbi:MAG: GNAT family N-acetyltransferase [Phenylobacterium sp.]|uniref:GNAT family N-acetyltransferase n=1 Tax=Phenylobacterium sp. TaxID=1871053 RepID=UPI00391EEE80